MRVSNYLFERIFCQLKIACNINLNYLSLNNLYLKVVNHWGIYYWNIRLDERKAKIWLIFPFSAVRSLSICYVKHTPVLQT
jgi:hypothetical protein